MSVTATDASPQPSTRGWNITLWIVQIILFVLFLMPGIMKTFMAPASLAPMGLIWTTQVPLLLVRFIGICELAGAIAMILPSATRIYPFLTPLAALGFVIIQVLAIGFHTVRGEIAHVWPFNMMYLIPSLFVLWGRTRKAPIVAR